MSKIAERLKGNSGWVLAYGVFVGLSLVLQCLVPFILQYASMLNLPEFIKSMVNQKFILPMDVITDFYAAIVAVYVGVDRGAFTIATFKEKKQEADYGNRGHLIQIIWQNIILYSLAVLLNLAFDTELAVTPLAVALGSSILLYVAGNKVIMTASKITINDIDGDGIDDSLQDQTEVLERYKLKLKEREDMLMKLEAFSDQGYPPEKILESYRAFLRKKGYSDIELKDLDEDGIEDARQDAGEVLLRLKDLVARGKAIGIRSEITL